MQKQLLAVKSNIFFLKQGVELLSAVSDEQYSSNNGKYNKSGIGRHFRHIVEHYYSLLAEQNGFVDYDARERDLRLENDREFMIQSMEKVSESLRNLNSDDLERRIKVRSNEGIGEENAPLSESTIRRELQFLISHTVHHYALIGLILKTMGFEPSPEFGIAPSTLKYEQEFRAGVEAS
ncbi:MAG: hypothetical protein JJ971_11280 [Balneolaceae bacterium]|nr:hypothetical protein [Balneolaceae bacterium]MBO6546169.1 hypothetical protein [Balneolaceae bacterium]MBO6648527.1 hypothetical protein [Balneolaceae bacterium]